MFDLVRLAILVSAWCTLHSLLIATPLTRFLRARLGRAFRFHRLAFNSIAVATLIPILQYEARIADEVLFAWEGSWTVLRAVMIALAAFFFWAGGRHYDLLQFLGLRQLRLDHSGGGLRADGGLDTSGILGNVRHPWYFGSLLLIWARPIDASVIVLNTVVSVFLVVGTMLEDRKLVEEFGEGYREYQRRVPMLLPRLRRG